jgi:hypothetical protein
VTAYDVEMRVTVRVEVGDDGAILRAVDNHDATGSPQADERSGNGWRNVYYPLRTPDDVLEHLAYNAIVNGVEDASRLDGWADLSPRVVTMRVTDADLDYLSAPLSAAGLRGSGDGR